MLRDAPLFSWPRLILASALRRKRLLSIPLFRLPEMLVAPENRRLRPEENGVKKKEPQVIANPTLKIAEEEFCLYRGGST